MNITKQLLLDDILALDQRYRATLINSLSGFKSLALIGTQSLNQQTNLAIFNSIVHIGANPPYLGFIVRPDSVERHTLENILETKSYTINHIHEGIYKQAHQTSARYPKEISEFDAVNLTPQYHDNFYAPFVKESHIQIGLEFVEKIDIKINNTIMLIGQINQLHFPEDCLNNDGFVDLEKAGTITCVGLDSYHKTAALSRLSYAKPDTIAQSI
ncbi:MAG: flavin reductase [Bacteroidetes bacterium]|nr:flavin reductase [Bacteroidota bacterium]